MLPRMFPDLLTGARLARTERLALCDLALHLGPDAPTLCGGWTAKDLVTHLLVRERSPLAAGIFVPPLARFTEQEMTRIGRADFEDLVDRLRHPRWTPVALPPVDAAVNTVEYFVHHEDLRRAQPGWTPRELSRRDRDLLWLFLGTTGRGLLRGIGIPVVARRSDGHGTVVLRRGANPVVVTGGPAELMMFFHGRAEHEDVAFAGPPDAVATLRGASLGT